MILVPYFAVKSVNKKLKFQINNFSCLLFRE